MLRYIQMRLVQAMIALLGVSVLVFIIIRLSGDPTLIMLRPDASPEAVEAFRASYGLDKPIWQQLLVFIQGLLKGDFGESIRFREPAFTVVVGRLSATLQLTFSSILFASLLGCSMGILAAARRNTIFDFFASIMALLGQAIPSFWLGIMLLLLFGLRLQLLPTSGRGTFEHLLLPMITLGSYSTARIFQLVRSGILEVLNKDYIRTARAKGISERVIFYKHALKNVALPIITMIGMQTGFLLGGSVVVETVFAWPGVGRLVVQSIFNRDYPIVQAIAIMVAGSFIMINLVVDISYGLLDPRIKYK